MTRPQRSSTRSGGPASGHPSGGMLTTPPVPESPSVSAEAQQIRRHVIVEDPPFMRHLFGDTRFAWLWVPLRLYLGYSWLTSGWGKVGNPAWMDTGTALQGFWTNAVRVEPRPVIAIDWYRAFIQMLLDAGAYSWFGKVIAVGETLIGVCLILGAFTGIAAFFGGLLN